MFLNLKDPFHHLQHLLRSQRRFSRARAIVDQHGKFIASQSSHCKAFAEQTLQTVRDPFEQQITDVMAQAVIDDFEVIKIDHQQRAPRRMP